MTIDSTKAYGDAARRVRRVIAMHGSDSVVVLDDIVPAKDNPGRITTQFQAAMKPEIKTNGNHPDIMIPGKHGKLTARTFGYSIEYHVENRTFDNESWHWSYLSEDGPKNWYAVTGSFQGRPERPLVTVLTPSRKKNTPPEATGTFEKKTVRVTFPGDGPRYTFTNTKNGWRFQKLN